MSDISKRTRVGIYTITVAKKAKAGMKIPEHTKELVEILARFRGLLTEPERLECSRCGATYDQKRHGDTPILGQIEKELQIVVEDSNAKEAVFYCHSCNHLFITKMTGQYIRVVR